MLSLHYKYSLYLQFNPDYKVESSNYFGQFLASSEADWFVTGLFGSPLILHFYYSQNRNEIVWHFQHTIRGFERIHVLFSVFRYVFSLHHSLSLFNCCLMICLMAWHTQPVISLRKRGNFRFCRILFSFICFSSPLVSFSCNLPVINITPQLSLIQRIGLHVRKNVVTKRT